MTRRWKRREKRIAWTLAGTLAFLVVALGALWLTRPRAEKYVPGQQVEGITDALSRDRPADAPAVRFSDVTADAGIDFRHFDGRALHPAARGHGLGRGLGRLRRRRLVGPVRGEHHRAADHGRRGPGGLAGHQPPLPQPGRRHLRGRHRGRRRGPAGHGHGRQLGRLRRGRRPGPVHHQLRRQPPLPQRRRRPLHRRERRGRRGRSPGLLVRRRLVGLRPRRRPGPLRDGLRPVRVRPGRPGADVEAVRLHDAGHPEPVLVPAAAEPVVPQPRRRHLRGGVRRGRRRQRRRPQPVVHLDRLQRRRLAGPVRGQRRLGQHALPEHGRRRLQRHQPECLGRRLPRRHGPGHGRLGQRPGPGPLRHPLDRPGERALQQPAAGWRRGGGISRVGDGSIRRGGGIGRRRGRKHTARRRDQPSRGRKPTMRRRAPP